MTDQAKPEAAAESPTGYDPAPPIAVAHLNAYVYCPRRFFLEHNRGMFEDNIHTVEGRSRHRTVDAGKPRPSRKAEVIHRRSVSFSSAKLGIIGRLDLLEEDGAAGIYPVEYKKGKKPKNREPWLNDRIQLCAQALLMRENGLPVPEKAFLYYIGSRARVEVAIDESLIRETIQVIHDCRRISTVPDPPPLAENRNKCHGCSLIAICLPEEEEVLRGRKVNARSIMPMTLDGDLLYVDQVGAYLGLSGGNLRVTMPGGEAVNDAGLETLREIVICGPAQVTSQAVHACLHQHVPIHYLNFYGQYVGSTLPVLHHHGLLRQAQWRAHFDAFACLTFARVVVESKLTNMRTLMMRYRRQERDDADQLRIDGIKKAIRTLNKAETLDMLRGMEGSASRFYFSGFEQFMKPEKRSFFFFNDRNRRPPRDPVNALLSFGYSLLAKDCIGTAARVGFDPYCGYYHSMKYGRPSLALDIMELFRQPIVDSIVVTTINNGVLKEKDFYQYQNVCYLNEKGRKKFLIQYEMRKKDMITHPRFHYRMSYARTIELQYRLLGKYLLGEVDGYEGFHIR